MIYAVVFMIFAGACIGYLVYELSRAKRRIAALEDRVARLSGKRK